MKVICQNCFEVLADRKPDENYLRFDPEKVDSFVQGIDSDHCILTLCCPKCSCMVQIKV